MSKLVISLDGVVVREASIAKEKTTLGRRPYNDIVIDNLAVSGEHAMFHMMGPEVFIEDLKSTNGTYVNGAVVKRQRLAYDDVIEIGKYKIKFLAEGQPPAPQDDSGSGDDKDWAGFVTVPGSDLGLFSAPAPLQTQASIRVLNGAAAGREVQLTKDRTTLGKPGVQVAAINKRGGSFLLTHVEGAQRPTVNGAMVTDDGLSLRNGDVIELAGTRMQFTKA
ncbi:MAG: FHA domain-containing protein [Betaproteobacteria bacterium]|jgi:predicted component of type VI protein secretion system